MDSISWRGFWNHGFCGSELVSDVGPGSLSNEGPEPAPDEDSEIVSDEASEIMSDGLKIGRRR
jgi:hypothetical protein